MRIVMMGTGTFAEPTFEALLAAGERVVGLVTQPDRDAGNKRGSTRQTGRGMATIANEAAVPVVRPASINAADGLAALQAFAPDLLVVAAYGQILSKAVIRTPTVAAINVHASLLPKYRGASPIAHAILNGETRTGVTILRIEPALDAGEMLAKEEVEIRPDETTGELEARLAPIGARLCVDVVRRLKAGPVSGETQDPALVTKAPKLTKEMGLIDWSQPAERVVNHVRAMHPWPTAYTFLHRPGKEPMRVIVGRVGRPVRTTGRPPHRKRVGELWELPDGGPGRLLVAVSDGGDHLPVVELQPAGKKRMTAAEFLRGHPLADGCRFGPERLS
jgi:methionyl-tRNA formyltransferase